MYRYLPFARSHANAAAIMAGSSHTCAELALGKIFQSDRLASTLPC
jgi:hypothetical protein